MKKILTTGDYLKRIRFLWRIIFGVSIISTCAVLILLNVVICQEQVNDATQRKFDRLTKELQVRDSLQKSESRNFNF